MSFYEHFSDIEREILEERARRVAGVVRDTQQEETLSVLIITLHGERYGIPVQLLTAVYEDTRVVTVPCTPAFVSGVANIRGHILPVFDLGNLLGLAGEDETSHSALFVVENDSMTIAFHVDTIDEIRNYEEDRLSSVPTNFELAQSNYVAGILNDNTPLLDLNTLLNDPAIIVDDVLT